MGGFLYSREDGTPAARYRGQVGLHIAQDRLGRLMEEYDRWSSHQSVDKIGRTMRCLIERQAEGQWEGRTMHDAPDIDGRITVPAGQLTGPRFYDLVVSGADGVDLSATLPVGHLPLKKVVAR